MKGSNYFIDTNIFLRPILKDDKKKVRDCRKLINKIKQGEIKAVTAAIVFAEIAWITK